MYECEPECVRVPPWLPLTKAAGKGRQALGCAMFTEQARDPPENVGFANFNVHFLNPLASQHPDLYHLTVPCTLTTRQEQPKADSSKQPGERKYRDKMSRVGSEPQI